MGTRTRLLPCEGPWRSTFTTKYRHRSIPEYNYDDVKVVDNSWIVPYYLTGNQVTDSESHPGWNRHRKGRFQGDVGGPFSTTKRWVELDAKPISLFGRYDNSGNITTYEYTGAVLPIGPAYLQFPLTSGSSDDDLSELGTKAIAVCSPSNPSVDLAVTIGELIKDGIPAALGATLRGLKSLTGQQRRQALGKEYLNVEFGWKPLINDLSDFASTILHVDRAFAQYERDSGKMVRRSYDFPEQKSVSLTTIAEGVSPWTSPSSGGWVDYNSANQGRVVRLEEASRRQWFRGAFCYYVPPADGLRNNIARAVIQARKVLGLSLTPDVLWNLAPWSWGLDWFGSTGDLLANWTDWAIDNQVLLYGYMMEHSLVKYTYIFEGPTGLLPPSSRPPSISLIMETKKRIRATPFGFGLRWSDLSPRQLAIAAALGISKSR